MTKRIKSVWTILAMLAIAPWMAPTAEAAGATASRSCLTSGARNILARIEQNFGRVDVISTCRPGARIAGTGHISRHASGNAVDFNAGSRKGAIVRWLIANHRSGGTMTYGNSSHIHVDIGHHFVSLAGSRTRTAARSSRFSGRMALGGPRKHRRSESRRSEGSYASRGEAVTFFNAH
jgi:hypothetical protein